MARRVPLLSSQPLPTIIKKNLFSKFGGTTTAPTLGLQRTQQAFDKIIRDVASKKTCQFYSSCFRSRRRQEEAQEPEEDGEAVSKDTYDLE